MTIEITVDDDGTYMHDGRQVFVVYSDDSRDHTGSRWWTNDDHHADIDDAESNAYNEGYNAATADADAQEAIQHALLDGLIELVGPEVIQESARLELRSTAVKQELSRKGVI